MGRGKGEGGRGLTPVMPAQLPPVALLERVFALDADLQLGFRFPLGSCSHDVQVAGCGGGGVGDG